MVCAVCDEVLSGHYVELGEQRYHEEHFNCSECAQTLLNRDFKFRDGKPVCASGCAKSEGGN